MSRNRFTRRAGVPGEPPVCKSKKSDPPPVVPPTDPNPGIAHVTVEAEATPTEMWGTGFTFLRPYAPYSAWHGQFYDDPFLVTFDIDYSPGPKLFLYTIHVWRSGFLQLLMDSGPCQAQTLNPFDSGLLRFTNLPGSETGKARVLA